MNKSKRKIFMTATAVVTAGAVCCGAFVVNRNATRVSAKESFAGVGQVVKEHVGKSYTILDVVPAYGEYAGYKFSLGTMGYMASGQSTLDPELARVLKTKYAYADRKGIADELFGSSIGGNIFSLQYTEGYPGIDANLDTYQKLFESVVSPTEGQEVPVGSLEAYIEKWNQAGEPTAGYDYDLIGSGPSDPSTPDTFKADANGKYHVIFGSPSMATSGYRVLSASDDLNAYSTTTGVYKLVDGIYEYAGTIASVNSIPGNTDSDDNKPGDTTPEDNKPGDSTPGDNAPGDNTPGDDQPGDNTPGDNKPGDDQPGDNTPGDNQPGDDKPGDNTPGDNQPGDDKPGDNTPGDNQPGDNTPGDMQPGDSAPEAGQPESDSDNNKPGSENAGLGQQADAVSALQWVKLVAEVPEADDANADQPADGEEITPNGDENPGTKYYVVMFEYVSNLATEENLYQAISKEEIPTAEGTVPPYDRYEMEGSNSPTPGNNAMGEDGENLQPDGDGINPDGVPVYQYKYVGSGKGLYKMTRANSSDNNYALAVNVELQNVPVYFKCCSGSNVLERYVFNSIAGAENAQNGFKVEVKTVTPGEVTTAMAAEADLIYLESGMNSPFSDKMVVKKLSETETEISDLSEGAFVQILGDVVVNSKPIIADYDAVDTAGIEYKNSVYYDLVRSLLKEDLYAFYYDMSKGNKLLPNAVLNLDSVDYPDKKSNNYHYVNKNVYIVSGTPLVNADFVTAFDDATAQSGFDEVIRAIQTENIGKVGDEKLREEITKAKAVQYIISLANGLIGEYKDLTILELQPTHGSFADLHLESDSTGTVMYWQKDNEAIRSGNAAKDPGQQILNTKKELKAVLNLESVVQFNGELDDINSTYDMIFIGLDAEYADVNQADGKYVYNDTALTGWAYHLGDKMSNADTRYDANDITKQKKEDLLGYLRAGYPIVVEDQFFTTNTTVSATEANINTAFIDRNTNMYAFLVDALKDYNDSLYTVRDVRGNATFRTQLNMVKPELVDKSDEVLVVRNAIESATEPGMYSVQIPYEIVCTRNGTSTDPYPNEVIKKVYLDVNYDGCFSQNEILPDTEYADVNSTMEIKIRGTQNGCIPWKIEACDKGNEYRRTSLSGFITVAGNKRHEISVLQIMDDPAAVDATNLEIYEKDIKNMVLNHYLNVAETRLNVDYSYTSISIAQLNGRLTENANYINEFDILVLGLEQTGSLGNATAAVEAFMNAGGSTLICRDALLNNDFLTQSTVAGISSERSYIELGKASGEKYRYNVLTSQMLADADANYAEMINFGSIGYYPFELQSVPLSSATHADHAKYQLRIGENDPLASDPYVTAWYTMDKTVQGMNAFKASPNDAVNNYYVASKANVVYLGQKKYPYTFKGTEPDEAVTDGIKESQLFVNALMAAYNAGTHSPKVTIVAGFGVEAEKVQSVCVPYDEDMRTIDNTESGMLEDTVDVYFTYEDNNIALKKENNVVFYYEDPSAAEVDMGNNKAKATAFASKIYTVENNRLVEVAANQLKPGIVYRISAPVVPLKNDANKTDADIYIVINSKLKRATGDKDVIASDSVMLNRAQLFLLE